MNYSFLNNPNFTTLKHPDIDEISDHEISKFTQTKPLISPPPYKKTKNPIVLDSNPPDYHIYWSHESILHKTHIFLSRENLEKFSETSYKFETTIISLHMITSPEKSLLVETQNGYTKLTLDLQMIENIQLQLKDIHINPFYPNQIAYLTPSNLTLVSKVNFELPCLDYKGFEFHFSPFNIFLYKDSIISIKDMRIDSLINVYTGKNIHQILPIDCCFMVAILEEDLKIYDCRYWKEVDVYECAEDTAMKYLMSFPQRSAMYVDGMVSENHQKVYAKGMVIEEFPHNQIPYLDSLVSELGPLFFNCKLPRTAELINNVHNNSLNPLLAAYPLCYENQCIWLETSTNGGLFIENSGSQETRSSAIFFSTISSNHKLQTVRVHDCKEYFEALVKEKFEIPESTKPKLNLNVLEPDFEDFEDDF